MFLIENISQNW